MAEEKLTRLAFATLDEERAITWPCTIRVPMEGGAVESQRLDCSFKMPSEERITQYASDMGKAVMDETAFPVSPRREFVEEFLTGFPGFAYESGDAVPFVTAKTALLSKPYALAGICDGLIAMARGREAKNS